MRSEFAACARRGAAGDVMELRWGLRALILTQNFQLNKTRSLFPAPAKRMRAQLHRVIVLAMYISAIITGVVPWFTVVAVDPGCTQGHHYARHL